jgi:hypothetical protein
MDENKRFELTKLGNTEIIRDIKTYNFINLYNACKLLNELEEKNKEQSNLIESLQAELFKKLEEESL